MKSRIWLVGVFVMANPFVASPVWAQNVPASAVAAPSPVREDLAVLIPAEPDVVVVNLPTALRMPLFKGNFRMTHRFGGNLRNGSFGLQAGNLFGLDQGAIIGFEYRMAIAPSVEAGFYRSSFDKTIQLYGKYDALRQRGPMPVSVSGLVSVEGANNFRQTYAPAVGVVVSRLVGTRLALYATPMWVNNTAESQNTTYVGFGGRLRVRGSTYVAAEVIIRSGGYAPDQPAYGFSIEKRAGSHMFSLTFTNTFGTTFAQLARGGAANSLYLGFNLSRKFF